MRMTVLLRAAALPVLLMAGACYRYEPIEAPRPGMDVRARLDTEAAVRRSAGLDEPVVFLSGRVVGSTPESLTLDVLVVRDPSVFSNIEIRDTVNVGMAEIRELTVRRLDTGRSLLFAGALGAGAYLVVRGITAIVGGNEGDDDGGGPQFDRRVAPPLRLPIFSVPVP